MPSHSAETTLKDYQRWLEKRLKTLSPIFAKAAIGDFSGQVNIPEQEDELSEFFVGVQIVLDAIREKIAELETSLSELHVANNIIATEKTRVEAILDGIGEGIVTVNQNWRVDYVNEPAITLLGENARILGQDAAHILRLEDEKGVAIPESAHPILKAVNSRRRIVFNLANGPALYARAGAERRRVALTITPIVHDSKVTGAAVVLRDITEEANIDWAKSEIVSIASHQLRTPLTAIKWYMAALLREDDDLSLEQTHTYMQRVYDANQHMINLVDDLLNVSRIDLGTLAQRPQAIDIATELQKNIKELAVEIKQKGLRVKVKDDPSIQPAFIDPNALHIILQNLLSNAVKYSPKDTQVIVTLQQQAQHARITVSDQGYGIPADQQRKIFTKLFRASNATRIATEGSGLGLYIAKAMVEQAGGQIGFTSAEGKGSSFYVIIPSKIA